jgi:hypothetical protein
MFKIRTGDTAYCIVGPSGEESESVDYGELAELKIGSARYIALVEEDPDDDENIFSVFGDDWVLKVEAGLAELEEGEEEEAPEEGEVETEVETDD